MRSLATAAALLFCAAAALAANRTETAEKTAFKAIDDALKVEPGLPAPLTAPRPSSAGKLGVQEAVRLALANNPSIERRREELRVQALSVDLVRHSYEPQLRGTISAVRGESATTLDAEIDRTSVQRTLSSQTLGLTQRLPLGGYVSLDVGGYYGRIEDEKWSYAPTANVSLNQPLLRGAGYAYNFEQLTQSKRSLLYGLRGFKLQREQFAIEVVAEFLSILSLREMIANQEKAVSAYSTLTKSTEALAKLGKSSEIEVLRATQQMLYAENYLQDLRTQAENRSENFKLMIRHPVDQPLEMDGAEPPFRKLEIDPDEAVRVALENRVDLRTAADLVDDRERSVRFAGQDMLPDLNLSLNASIRNTDARSSYGVIHEDYSAAITLSLPLDRTGERFRLYSASQELIRTRRDLGYTRDAIAVGIRNSIRQIERLEGALEIYGRLHDSELKRYRMSLHEFEQGRLSNYHVIEPIVSLLNVANTQSYYRTAHYAAKLRLLRDMGVLDIDRPLPEISAR